MRVFFTSNARELFGGIRQRLHDFGFDSRGASGATVGEEVHQTFTDGIKRRCDESVDPDGNPWDANSDIPEGRGYATRKREVLGHAKPNVYTGSMTSEPSIAGVVHILHQQLEHEFGTGVRPVTEAGKVEPSDRDKAKWAHEGQSKKKIIRPFFGITEADADKATEEVADALIEELL
jgi:hypothetical protein